MDVGILSCSFADFCQNRFPLGIVRRAATGKDQLAIEIALHNLVGAHYSNWILQSIEPGNLRENGALRINLIAAQDFGNYIRLHFTVLVRKRVNRRIEKILGDGQLAREGRRRKNGGIVSVDKRRQEIPDLQMRLG